MAGQSSAVSGMSLEEANNIWQCVKHKVVTKMCGSGWTPTPHLQDAHMFHPLSVIGKRVERSLRLRKVRSLFPLGPLSELREQPENSPDNPATSPDRQSLDRVERVGPIPCDMLHEEFLDGVGRVRIMISDYWTECGVQPLAPNPQLCLRRSSLPWLDSVHRLYLVSQTICSSSCRIRLLGAEASHQMKLGPDTPLGFVCLRLSLQPSGTVEVRGGVESGYLHPKARWARFGSPEYERLTGGTGSEPRVMSILSHLAFSFAHPSTMSLPMQTSRSEDTLSPEPEQRESEGDNPEEGLLPLEGDAHYDYDGDEEMEEDGVDDDDW
ncbi:uncharacterized protein LOC134461723 [Engraulis encrasicolus]|uniref:uncharacterized protein LOC134461723 n=1 Tax=Engraulis encrasicolus TaxID=184585 RepID=UPI002FD069A9